MVVQSVPPRAWISWNSREAGDHQISEYDAVLNIMES